MPTKDRPRPPLDKEREYSRRCKQKKVYDALVALGGKCAHCGIADLRVLQIDHVVTPGCEERRSLTHGQIIKRVPQFPGEYQALCANCHQLKSWPNRFKDYIKEDI